jgi:hypothetical protein
MYKNKFILFIYLLTDTRVKNENTDLNLFYFIYLFEYLLTSES